MTLKIGVIVATTRPERVGPKVANWFMSQVEDIKELRFELIDLADVNLPMFDESIPPMHGNYQGEHTKQWAKRIAGFDGFVIVTGEYNYGYPASIKNAIDYLYAEWGYKPVAFVSYGVNGGVRAVEQLKHVASMLKMMPLFPHVAVTSPWAAFNEDGSIKTEFVEGQGAQGIAEELLKVGTALKTIRT